MEIKSLSGTVLFAGEVAYIGSNTLLIGDGSSLQNPGCAPWSGPYQQWLCPALKRGLVGQRNYSTAAAGGGCTALIVVGGICGDPAQTYTLLSSACTAQPNP